MNEVLQILYCMFHLFTTALAFCINVFKGVFGFVASMFQKNRVKTTNKENRGVVEGGTCRADHVFSNNGSWNYIISGGVSQERAQILKGIIDRPNTALMPIIIMHQNDHGLVDSLRTSSLSRRLTIIDNQNRLYDPLHGKTEKEIARLLVEAAPETYDIKPNGEEYIEGLLLYRRALRGSQRFANLAECPFSEMFIRLDEKISNGLINQTTGNMIRSKLLAGQSELYKIRHYVQDLDKQIGQLVVPRAARYSGVSVSDALSGNLCFVIDLLDNANYLSIDLIIKEMELHLHTGQQIILVIDGIDVQENGALHKLIKVNRKNCKTIFATDDLFAMVNAEEKVFKTILGNNERYAIMRHSSGSSAAKWSEAIGYYDRVDVTVTSGSSQTQQIARLFPLYGHSASTAYANKRENIIKPEEITRLSPNEAYVYESDSASLTHLRIE